MDMCEAFSDALEEEGLDAEVLHSNDPATMGHDFLVKKTINGEPLKNRTRLTFDPNMDEDARLKLIAMEAGTIARSFDEYFTERVEWGDNCVQFDAQDGYEATCFRCGNTVSIDDLEEMASDVSMAEATVPNPPAPDFESLPDMKLQMALLAILRETCEPICENSPRDPINHRNI